MENILVVVFFVLKRPPCFENIIALLYGWRKFTLRVELESQIGRKDFSEEKVSLLMRKLVRERYGFGERNGYRALGGEDFIEHSWIVLKERHFDGFGGRKECR